MSVGSDVPMSSSIDSRPMLTGVSVRATAAPTRSVTAARHAAPNSTADKLCRYKHSFNEFYPIYIYIWIELRRVLELRS